MSLPLVCFRRAIVFAAAAAKISARVSLAPVFTLSYHADESLENNERYEFFNSEPLARDGS